MSSALIRRRAVVIHDDVLDDVIAEVAVEAHGVVVDVGRGFLVLVEERVADLAHDAELADGEIALEDLVLELRHAVEDFERRTGMRRVECVVDGDLDVQPRICIDDLVAPAAFDDVAAGAAKQNLSCEGARGRLERFDKSPQTRDEIEVGQNAAGNA